MEAIEDKRDRWERIIQEAAEQSSRAFLPQLLPRSSSSKRSSPAPCRAKAGASPPSADAVGRGTGSKPGGCADRL